MYKKLILTFTLAAGLSVLPNAFAAPPPAPGKQRTTTQAPPPKPNTTGTNKHSEDSIDVLVAFKARPQPAPPSKPNTTRPQNHGEDSIDVFAVDMTTAPEPKYKRPGRPPPKGKYGEDRIDVLALKARPQPAPPSKPNTTKTPVHSEDSITVLAWKQTPPRPGAPRPKGRHSEDSIDVLAADIPPMKPRDFGRPGKPKGRHGEDSTIV